jgi:hypothetical protein
LCYGCGVGNRRSAGKLSGKAPNDTGRRALRQRAGVANETNAVSESGITSAQDPGRGGTLNARSASVGDTDARPRSGGRLGREGRNFKFARKSGSPLCLCGGRWRDSVPALRAAASRPAVASRQAGRARYQLTPRIRAVGV